MLAVYKREFKSYFTSMTGPVFIAVLTAITGIYFMVYNLRYGYPYFSYTLGGVVFIFLLLIPVLTMRSLSDEKKSKTDQLILTSPISVTAMLMGKYLAMLSVFAIPMLIFCTCPLIIKMGGTAYFKADYATILAFFFMGAAYIAVGMFISSLTESQIIAAVGTFGILLFFYLIGSLVDFLPVTAIASLVGFLIILLAVCLLYESMTKNWMAAAIIGIAAAIVLIVLYIVKQSIFENALPSLLSSFSMTTVLDSFAYDHVFDMAGLLFYASIAFVFVFLSGQVIQRRRWS